MSKRIAVAVLLVLACANVTGAAPITILNTVTFLPSGTNPADALLSADGTVNWIATQTFPWSDKDYVRYQHAYTLPEGTITESKLVIRLADDADWAADEELMGLGPGARIHTWFQPIYFADIGYSAYGEAREKTFVLDVPISFLTTNSAVVVKVEQWNGDFYIRESTLEINYEPVPEPCTMLLLGSGLIGLWGARRKFKK